MADLDIVATRVAAKLIARKETIAISESSAGGLVSAALLAVPGASAFFMGGAVVYTMKAREVLLGITAGDIRRLRIRSASEPYAALCATRTNFSRPICGGRARLNSGSSFFSSSRNAASRDITLGFSASAICPPCSPVSPSRSRSGY